MKTLGFVTKVERVEVEIRPKELVEVIECVFDNQFGKLFTAEGCSFMSLRQGDYIIDGWIYRFSGFDPHKNDDQYKKTREATQEELKIYEAFKLVIDSIQRVEQNGM